AVAAAVLALGLALVSGVAGGTVAGGLFGLVLTAGGGAWLIAAWRRHRLEVRAGPERGGPGAGPLGANGAGLPARRVAGSGIAALREGAVGYFGPESGGVVLLDTLAAVSVVDDPAAPERAAWLLEDLGGQRLVMPAGATGDAEGAAVLDALVALPGFDSAAARRALGAAGARPATVWRRAGSAPVASPG
ncbi:MAG: hypothetical protein AAFR52_20785, partial [Pseudomonadota bacterium]